MPTPPLSDRPLKLHSTRIKYVSWVRLCSKCKSIFKRKPVGGRGEWERLFPSNPYAFHLCLQKLDLISEIQDSGPSTQGLSSKAALYWPNTYSKRHELLLYSIQACFLFLQLEGGEKVLWDFSLAVLPWSSCLVCPLLGRLRAAWSHPGPVDPDWFLLFSCLDLFRRFSPYHRAAVESRGAETFANSQIPADE